jgi:hypothetical protein
MATKTKTKARVRDLNPKKRVKGGGMVKSSDPDGPPLLTDSPRITTRCLFASR